MCRRMIIIIFGMIVLLSQTMVSFGVNEQPRYKVVIDAGHGGYDGGARGRHAVEKDINLQVALYLREYLANAGIEVIMVRERDESFAQSYGNKKRSDLAYRVELINRSGADLFVSIHMNAMPDPRWRGAQTFYHPKDERNRQLSETIQQHLKDYLKNTTREAKALKSIYLLNNVSIPGVLVEAGFLSNPEEEQLLLTPRYQEHVAHAIGSGIMAYLAKEEA